MEKKNLRKNSKEVKYVYNYIIDSLKDKQTYGDGNTYIFRLKYQYHYLCGDKNFKFMCYSNDYGIDLKEFWQKLFEYDTDNYNILESAERGFFNNNYYYDITLTDLIQDLNLKK